MLLFYSPKEVKRMDDFTELFTELSPDQRAAVSLIILIASSRLSAAHQSDDGSLDSIREFIELVSDELRSS